MSLNRLALEPNLDKGRASRAIADLISCGLIKRRADENDGRRIRRELIAKGRSLYRPVLPYAVQRNEELISVLSESERMLLGRVLVKVTHQTLSMFSKERKLSKGE